MTERWRPYQTFYPFPEYIEARDRLIPTAEAYATKVAGGRPTPVGGAQSHAGREEIQRWGNLWSLVYHREMNRLAAAEGLCRAR